MKGGKEGELEAETQADREKGGEGEERILNQASKFEKDKTVKFEKTSDSVSINTQPFKNKGFCDKLKRLTRHNNTTTLKKTQVLKNREGADKIAQ